MEITIARLEFENLELKKVDSLMASKRDYKKQCSVLNAKIEDLIHMQISAESKPTVESFYQIMQPILTPVQIEKIIYRKKQVVWKNEDLCRAFTLRYLGKRSYIYFRNELKLPLPGISTLQR